LPVKHVENRPLSITVVDKNTGIRFLPARLTRYGNVSDWLAGWLDVTRRYCIKTAKPILRLFRPCGSPIILVSYDTCADTHSKRNHFSWCAKYTGYEKLAIFDGNRRLSRKRCEIGRWLLRNVNRKSWVQDWMVTFSMTLSDLNPGFKVTVYLQVESQKRCVLGPKLLKNTNRKPYTINRMVPLSMTLRDLWPRLQGHDIFRHWISQKRH